MSASTPERDPIAAPVEEAPTPVAPDTVPGGAINWPVLERFLDALPERLEARLSSAWGMKARVLRGTAVAGRLQDCAQHAGQIALFGLLCGADAQRRGLIGLSPALASAFVAFVLGGRDVAGAEAVPRAATPFERTLCQPLVNQILEAFADAVAPAGALSLSLEGWGAVGEAVDCPALHLRLTIAFSGIEAMVPLALPLGFLEPLNNAFVGIFHGTAAESDAIWQESLQRQMSQAEVRVRAVLHEQMLPLGVMRHLAVGQSLVFDAPAEPLVTLTVEDIAIARGRLGRAGARIAVRLETGITARKETGQ